MTDATVILVTGAIGLALGQTVTFMTVVFNAWWQERQAKRNRQYEIEDRAELARQVISTSAALALTVTETSRGLSAQIAENTIKTDEATVAAKEAYREANHVNNKIAALGLTRGMSE